MTEYPIIVFTASLILCYEGNHLGFYFRVIQNQRKSSYEFACNGIWQEISPCHFIASTIYSCECLQPCNDDRATHSHHSRFDVEKGKIGMKIEVRFSELDVDIKEYLITRDNLQIIFSAQGGADVQLQKGLFEKKKKKPA
jgi:hypothetical protein